MKEVELKLLLDAASERRLRRAAGRLGGDNRGTARLRTVYLDTAEGRLASAGIALRLRREGRSWTQTVKTARAMRAGLSESLEINTPAPGGRLDLGAIPDEDLRGTVAEALGGLPAAPVYETEVRRTTYMIDAGPGALVELAIDRGEVRAGERGAALCEAELELKSGPPSALFELARELFPAGGLSFSTLSKAARGRLLLREGRIFEDEGARNARGVKITRGMTAEMAARDVLAECFEQIAENARFVRQCDDPEGPHQLRIGLRRLRTAIALFREPLASPALDLLAAEAQWLGQEVGRQRDLDVARVDLVQPAAVETPGEPGFAALDHALEARGAEERATLRETLTGQRVHSFLFDLAEFISLRGWLDPSDLGQTARLAEPVERLAERMLVHADKRAAKKARNIETLEIEARHDLRKALKKLRYAVEFMGPLYDPAEIKAFLKPLKTLQEIFGELNDAAMAEEMFLGENAPCAQSPEAARAAGRLIGAANARAEHAWADATARWKGFAAAPRPWAPKKAKRAS